MSRNYLIVLSDEGRAVTLENASESLRNEDNDYHIYDVTREETDDGYFFVCIQPRNGMTNEELQQFVDKELGINKWDSIVERGFCNMIPAQIQKITLDDIDLVKSRGQGRSMSR